MWSFAPYQCSKLTLESQTVRVCSIAGYCKPSERLVSCCWLRRINWTDWMCVSTCCRSRVCCEQITYMGSLGTEALACLRRYQCHFMCIETRQPLQGYFRTAMRSREGVRECKALPQCQSMRVAWKAHVCKHLCLRMYFLANHSLSFRKFHFQFSTTCQKYNFFNKEETPLSSDSMSYFI